MKRIYYPYYEWEDYINGMYDPPSVFNTTKAKELLSNQSEFLITSMNVLREWPKSADVNLSNISCNRQAWIGQAACCYKYGIPEIVTRQAWAELDKETQREANRTADKIIRAYEIRSPEIYQNMGAKMLF